jgi:prolyl oligopeptidase
LGAVDSVDRSQAGREPGRRDTAGVRVPPPLIYLVGWLVGWGINWWIGGPVVPRSAALSARLVPGVIMIVAGVGLAASAIWVIKRAGSTVAPMRPVTALVTGGPFRFSRNPMYLGLAFISAGVAVSFNLLWPVIILVVVVIPVIRRRVIVREEAYLERTFGREYRRYRERVGRWLVIVIGVAMGAVWPTGVSAQGATASQPLKYPEARRDSVVDTLFGTAVPAPYRWMEDLNASDVGAWITAENALTTAYLSGLPGREAIRARLTALWNYPRVGLPRREHGTLFYTKNSGLQRQSVLYMRAAPSSAPRVVIDPNVLSPDGSISLSAWAPSPDGRYLAYGLSEGGADWEDLHVREIASGRELPDTLAWVRFSQTSWTKDGRGFYYERFPSRSAAEKLSASLEGHTIYYHRVGTPQSSDRLIYARPDLPKWFVGGVVTEDGRYLLVSLQEGTAPRNRLYYASLGDPLHPVVGAPIKPLVETDDALYTPIEVVGHTLYVLTTNAAPKKRVMAIDLDHPDSTRWRTVVPESEHAIEDATMAGGRLVLQLLVDVKSELHVVSLAGTSLGTIALPGIGAVVGLSARVDTPEMMFAFTSPLYPPTVFRYDVRSGVRTAFEAPALAFDVNRYETREVFYPSKDGTKVPMFITAKKGLRLDGSNPTLLYAYGGFDISLTPSFSPTIPLWLEMGGVYATANLRGGGEYGEAWHEAGMFGKKQNVFDDFIAGAEYLVRSGVTSPAKLAIEGGSNGGLLIGAVLEQRPDLFGVALPAVGVMDMLRYDRFTGGQAWVTEYGSASDSTAFPYLIKYSPVQNVRAGTCYPATLATTADHDDRVVPSHSYKFTAALQAAQGCAKPVLIRVETEGSHGYLPTDKRIGNLADLYTFTAANLGVGAPASQP